MKYAITFVAIFAVVAAGAALVRVSLTGGHEDSSASNAAAPAHDDHAGHNEHGAASNGGAPTHDEHADHAEVKLDLRNTNDPVSGAEIGDDHAAHAHAVFHGFRIHFADEDSVASFTRRPDRYMQKLELERTLDGEVIKVDASTYRTAPLPAECPFCGMDLDAEGDIYILHRNFKIHFGWWGGCDQEFLSDPRSHYAAYGLEEKDGELVLKE